MLREDINLSDSDIQSLSDRDAIASFFTTLGYNVERLTQTAAAIGITKQSLIRHIEHIEQIAVQDGELYIYLFEMKSIRVADRQELARTFRNETGEFLLILTTPDYDSLDFVLLERVLPRDSAGNPMKRKDVIVQQHVLTVDRSKPDKMAQKIALRVLKRFTYTEEDVIFQLDKLLSAYTVAKWSRPMFNNRALFADYFLEHRLSDTAEWNEKPLDIYNNLLGRMNAALGIFRGIDAPPLSEEITRTELLEPVFQALGFTWTNQYSSDDDVKPDYVLTSPEHDKPIAYALTYRWNRYLDGRDMAISNGDDNKSLDAQKYDDNPGMRVVSLLAEDDAPPYIIVTNGKLWRLYAREAHSRATNYYEIDLEETLYDPDRDEAIRYFWLFFRGQAFVPVETTREGETRPMSFLDRVMAGSSDYAKQLEKDLKERIFLDIFPTFAEGFIRNKWGRDTPTQEELDAVYQATLTFLYRMMFLLYAEARDLLPIKEARGYAEISLKTLKDNIAKKAGVLEKDVEGKLRTAYSPTSTELYEQLTRLFAVIDKGDNKLNVPNYNGGLFVTDPTDDDMSPDAINARFLRDTKIPDRYLALGLDRLARDLEQIAGGGLVPIDYKSLGVRQLGSIYEGLLEFKVRVAPEKMAIVKGKRTEEIVPYSKAKKKAILTTGRGENKEEKTLARGTVYLENTKQERKASGSYYTPDYIVKYIVQHTVGPVLDEKFEQMRPRLRDAEREFFQWRKNNRAKPKSQPEDLFWDSEKMLQLAADVLDVKVLDPAMGSGHFLVEVVDFVTDRTLQFLDRFRYNPVQAQLRMVRDSILDNMETQGVNIDEKRLTDVNLLKRQVLKRCVYGVDLNRMAVELAKVSLWLDAFTLGAPLSFLDHHLRWGNSLIGTMARDADKELRGEGGQLTLFSGPFVGLLQAAEVMRGVSVLADATIEEAHRSADLFKSFEDAAQPYKQLLDVFVIQHFGVKKAAEFLTLYGADVMDATRDKVAKEYKAVLDQRETLYQQYRFFHWDLEFPEVFIDLNKAEWKENAGFDAVVGNPPYVRQEELTPQKPYFALNYEVYAGTADLFLYFYERALKIVQRKRLMGYITSGTFMNSNSAKPFREYIHENAAFEKIANFGENQPFEGAEMVYPTVTIIRSGKPRETFRSLFIEGAIPFARLPEAFNNGVWVDSLSDVTSMDEWRFQDSRLTKLFQKIQSSSSGLSEAINGITYAGVKTGFNEAFLIDEATYMEMAKEDSKTREIVKPMVRGQDLRPWYQSESGLFFIFTRHGIDIDAFPSVKHHLQQFRKQLEPEPQSWDRRKDGKWPGPENLSL